MKEVKRILWADDEIDLLRPHVLFLESKGYEVVAVSNGDDALAAVAASRFDAVLLDEMMPGRGGLETLASIQDTHPTLPIIMITKSEEEHLMNEAIGQRIRDYLTKPVNPSQIFLALKRIFEEQGIQRTTLTRDYLTSLTELSGMINGARSADEWLKIGSRLASWELNLDRVADAGLLETHLDQRREANDLFGRFIEANYGKWVQSGDRPLMSPDLLRHAVFPGLKRGERTAFILIDCMRLDLWRAIRPLIEPYFDVEEQLYYSILPTATPYARNAIFAGLFPRDIRAHHPSYWEEDSASEGSLNRFERELLEANLARHGVPITSWKYQRVFTPEESTQLRRQAATFASLEFVALVFNFLDIMAHGRSDSDILRELAPDETAFRNLLVTWFSHSTLFEFLRTMADTGTRVVITTDHGAVLVGRSSIVTAGKDASTNLRYKHGSNLKVDPRQAIHIKRPGDFMLPDDRPTKNYLFAKENFFFVYPNNFHHYERQFKQTFQHGGVSLEEMVLPVSILTPRRSR